MKKTVAGLVCVVGFSLVGGVSAQACTTVLVGKDVSTDGSTIIARNEDMGSAWAKHFVVREANSNEKHFVSKGNQFTIDLPAEQMKYTATPEWDVSEGLYEEAGINSAQVAMSGTESGTTKEEILKIDPYVEDGVAEDSIVTVVLPYIKSAKEGVQRLAEIVKEKGSAETNGVIFSDKNEIWYMELLSGHQWVAARVPDDKYAVIANKLSIGEIDWEDQENYLYSDTLKTFIEDNKLAEDVKKASIWEIFSDTKEDAEYNTPRVWDGQRVLTPSQEKQPTDTDFKLFETPDEKISVAKVGFVLRQHFNGTKYDTYAGGKDSQKYRPINVPRAMESHILQFRNDVPNELSGIHWLALGVPETSQYVPFYAGITKTPENYQIGTDTPDNESAYWTYRTTNVLTVPYYKEFKKEILPVRQEVRKHLNEELAKTDAEAAKILKENKEQLADYLNKQTGEFAKYSLDKYRELNQQLIVKMTEMTPVQHNEDL